MMANGLAMTSAGHRGSEGGHVTRFPAPVSAIFNIGLLLASCVAFVLAKSITTHGQVHIDDVEYWLVGAVPPALLYGLSLVTDRFFPDAGRDFVARRLLTTWLLALAAFCISKEMHIYEALRSVVEATAGIGRDEAELAMAFLFAGVASMVALVSFVARAPQKRSAIALSFASLVAISLVMHLLLSR